MATRVAVASLAVSVVLIAQGRAPALAQRSAADHHIAHARSILQRNPDDARALHRLGDAYVRKARETGDVAYFDRAERALRASLERKPDQAGVWRHLAYVRYMLHDFEQAAAHARRAIALDGTDSHAHGVLGDALLEVGRHEEAEPVYRRMMALGPDLYAHARLAGLKSLRGDTAGAIAALERAIADGRAAGAPGESVAWTLWQLGMEHAAIGRLSAADTAFAEALRVHPGYHRALAGLAHVRAAQGRHDEAVTLYTRALSVVPLPEYAAALGDVYTRLDRPADARRQYDLVEYIGRLNAVNQVLYSRELAYFYADHDVKLDVALALAQAEARVRQDVHAHDVLAWALHKNGRVGEARTAIARALRLGTVDARLFFHAGLIFQAAGDREQARRYLARALQTNPQFHVLHADVARRALAALEAPSPGATPAAAR
jgi:tetratricopeptide (TPR) repeat protein